MAEVRIPVQTRYDGAGFRQAQQDAAKLRRLQERHNRAVLQETKQQIAEQRRLANLTRKLERDLQREADLTAAKRKQAAQNQAAALALVAAGAVQFGRESINAAREQAGAEAQLEAAIRSTGGAAGLTADELKALASQLQSVTNFGDEATIQAEALLLTFTNIGRDVFPRTTKAILDISTAMDQGLKETSIQVGKALNDPITGLTALRRVGIQFTEAQEKQIKTFVETNRLADAQAVILAELERQFGGSAEAARQADGNIIALGNAWGDLQEAVGRAITPSVEGVNDLIEAIEWLTDRVDRAAAGWREFGKQADIVTIGLHKIVFEGQSVGEAFTEAGREVEAAWKITERATTAATAAFEADTAAVEDNTDALEEQAKRLERVADIRHDAARDLLRIEEQNKADVEEVWSDYWTDQENEWQDHDKRLADIQKKAAKEAKKDEADLAKALRKLDQDTEKQITKVKKDAAKEQRQQDKRRQVDTLADERLFNFDLQQLAAEGQGNAIREAIERRAIEEQIAKEKAAVESQIEAEKQQDEISRIRETAGERRAQLREDHAEEKQLREERLAEELAAEEDNYAERMIALRQHREDKLVELENSKQEAIQKLGEELAEMQELTEAELGELVKVAEKLGEDFGAAFAYGVETGLETNREVNKLLGDDPGSRTMRSSPRTQRSSGLPRFQFGGTVPGPIGQPTLAVVHGGETVTPPGQAAHTFNVTINAAGGVNQARVEALFQQFTDEVLIPALS